MENIVADFTISNDNTINAEYSIEQEDNFDCSFEIFASGVVWGAITGNITDQTDLINILNEKATISYVDTNIQSEATSRAESDTLLQNNINTLSDNLTSEIDARTLADNNLQAQIDDINTAGYITKDVNDLSYYMLTTDINTALSGKQNTISDLADIRNNAENGNTAYNTIQNYGDIVTYNANNFATASQGALADTSIQPNDNITLLNNNAGYITNSALNGYATETYVNSQGFITIDTLDGYATEDFVTSQGYITSASLPTVNNSTITIQKNGSTVESFNLNQTNNETINITVPTDTNDLTNGAEFITSADLPTLSDLTTPAQLSAINSGATSTNIGQIATNTQAISTETLNRQNADNDLQSQIDAIVSSSDVFDIVGTYAELQAYDISTVPVNDIIKVLVDNTHNNAATYYRCIETDNVKSWSYIGSEGAYYTKSEADGRFVTNTSLTTILTDYVLSSDLSTTLADYVTSANLTTILGDYATQQWVNNQGYITGITSSDVTTALGFTPYDSTNPDGFITSADLPTNYVTTDTVQNITAEKTFVGNKLLKFKGANSSSKLGFTAYDSSNREVGYLECQGQGNASHKCRLGVYDTNTSNYDNVLGFEYYKAKGSDGVLHRYNLLCPPLYPSTTDASYYIPMAITDGNTTVMADNTGSVDISSLLPDVSNYVTNTSLATTLADYATQIWVTNQGYTTNVGTVTSVNNTLPDANGNVTISTGGTVDQTYDGTSTNAQSGVAIEGAGFLKNNANDPRYALAIGTINSSARATVTYATAIGAGTEASGIYSLAIGQGATATANSAIQIGSGLNSTANTLKIGFADASHQYSLLDGTTGLIPDARISTNIARTSDIPDISTKQDTLVSGTNIKTINSTSLLGSGNIDVLQNTATGSNSITILGTATSGLATTNIGYGSTASGMFATAIGESADASAFATALGRNADASGDYATAIGVGATASNNYATAIGESATASGNDATALGVGATASGIRATALGDATTAVTDATALGHSATASANYAIQIGSGTNSTASTLAIGFNGTNWQLLDGTTGLIPYQRLNEVTDNNSGSLKFWSGTQAEYDAITTKDSNTIYNVEDTTSPVISILDSLYPVGAIYIGTMSACPLQTLGIGTWQLVAQDRVLQGAGNRGSVGTTINESLPNIKGSLTNYFSRNGSSTSSSNVLYQDNMTSISVNSGSQAGGFGTLHINAANASSTYQDDAPVQQDAYLVNIWERVA